ncbi:MAG: hypothetical protein Q4A49_00785 [Neisseria sp.]|nr:hypothetical protein [Neisseria sp.]
MRQSVTFPLILIVGGAIWFLKAADILPATSTLISAALVIVGFVILVADGINKHSVVAAPLLMYLGGAIYLRNEYFFAFSPLFALGMMLAGCLMLLARSSMIPQRSSNLPE